MLHRCSRARHALYLTCSPAAYAEQDIVVITQRLGTSLAHRDAQLPPPPAPQCAFPSLRNDDRLVAFNKRLAALNYDLRKWRAEETKKGARELNEGFELLDMDGGAGWDLLCQVGGLLCAQSVDVRCIRAAWL